MPDEPLCGDLTCESEGCRQSAINAWRERMDADARALVCGALGLDNPSVNLGVK